MFKLFLFGTPRCQQDGHIISLPRRKCLALLAYVALNPQPHSREELAALLYPNTNLAFTYLRRTLSEIRQSLGNALLLTGNAVRLAENGLWVDALEFIKLANAGKGKIDSAPLPIPHLQTATTLYTADFMTGFTLPDAPAYDEWQFFQGESLRQTLASALQTLMAWHNARREWVESIAFGRRWLALDPLDELTHRQLMQLYAAAGQQSAALRQYDECVRLLHDELGITPATETKALYETIRNRHGATGEQIPLFVHTTTPQHNFPPPTNPFVGRQAEIAHISHILSDDPNCRLVTIVGQGGIGKTRLALEVGRQLLPNYTHGTYFVPLAPVSQPDDLGLAIAAAMSLPLSGPKAPREHLLDNLQRQHLLLILDNFEHLLAGVDLLTDILLTAPGVKLLVTSRERLNIQSEWAYDLAGLTFPSQSTTPESTTPDGIDVLLATYSAPALFVQRVQQARAAFKPSVQNWSAILRICRLVEGMPLGLELAASWIPAMSCQEIAAGIAHSLDFLTTTLRDVPDRHRSLRAVFQHSWSLLTAEEKAVLRQLSVFRGGFTREAAEQVTGTMLLPLAGLVRKSLVVRERHGRYTIHELLRQFAAERLAESPTAVATTQKAHATYFATFLQEREADLWAGRQLEALNEITTDLDNVRQGWLWAVEQNDLGLLNYAALALFFFFDIRGHIQEGERIFRLAEQQIQPMPATSLQRLCLGKLLMGRGWFAILVVSFVTGADYLQQAVTWLRSVEPPAVAELSLALNYLGLVLCFRGSVPLGTEVLQESLMLAREARSQALMGRSLFNLGQTAVIRGEYKQAIPYLVEASRLVAAVGEQKLHALTLSRLGEASQGLGEYHKAESYIQESIAIRQQLEDRMRLPSAIQALGLLAYRQGDDERAESLVQESLAMNQQTGNLYQIGENYEALGLIALARGHLGQAEMYLNRSLTIFREMGIHNKQPDILNSLARLTLDRHAHELAEPLLAEALALTQVNGNVAQQARTLHLCGEMRLNEATPQGAARNYAEALGIVIRIGAAPLALSICLSAARLYLPPHGNQAQQAATLLQLVFIHPATEAQTRQQAETVLATIAAVAPLLEVKEGMDLWTEVAHLKADLTKESLA